MRYSILLSLLFLLCVAITAALTDKACAGETRDFLTWAVRQSENMDRDWTRITGDAGHGGTSGRIGPVGSGRAGAYRRPAAAAPAHGRSWSFTSSGYVHKGKSPFLPLSTRPRGTPSRSFNGIKNPARTMMAHPHHVRRPIHSRVQVKNFRSGRKSVSRPRLDSFGTRMARGSRRSRGGSRPAYRADRPKLF